MRINILILLLLSFQAMGFKFEPIPYRLIITEAIKPIADQVLQPAQPNELFTADQVLRLAKFSADESKLLLSFGQHVGPSENSYQIWDITLGKKIHEEDDGGILAISPTEEKIFATVQANLPYAFEVVDANNGKLLFNLEGHTAAVERANFSSDGSKVLTASRDGTIKIWNAHDGTLISTIAFEPAGFDDAISIQGLIMSDDGKKVFLRTMSGFSSFLWVFNVENGKRLFKLRSQWYVVDTSFSANSEHLQIVTSRGLNILNAENGNQISPSIPMTNTAGASFSIDQTKVVSYAQNPQVNPLNSLSKIATVWDLANNRSAVTLEAALSPGEQTIGSIFSHDGTKVLTLGQSSPQAPSQNGEINDHQLRIWDVASGKPLYTVAPDKNNSTRVQVAFSRSGTKVLYGSVRKSDKDFRGVIEIWLLPPNELVNPNSLKMQNYSKIIRDFMNSDASKKDYPHYIEFLAKRDPLKSKADIIHFENNTLFSYLSPSTQLYLRHLITERPPTN